MDEGNAQFNDYAGQSFAGPAFARNVNAAARAAVDAAMEQPGERQPDAEFGQSHAILTGGKPHPAIAGLMTLVDGLDLATDIDLGEAGDSLWSDARDDQLYRESSYASAMTMDVAEMTGVAVGHYVGQNFHDDDGGPNTSERDVYLTSEPVRSFILNDQDMGDGSREQLGENKWKYYGYQARLKRPPQEGDSEIGEIWEPHPDATTDADGAPLDPVTLYNEAEYLNSATLAAGQAIDDVFTGVEPINGVVKAVRRSYPAYMDSDNQPQPAGVCWVFNKENTPIINCADSSGGEDTSGYGGGY